MYNMSMIKNKKTFFLGVFIFLLPFLGLPTSWKMTLVTISGIFLVLFSVKISIPKKLPRRAPRKRATPVFVESMPVQPVQPMQSVQPTISVDSVAVSEPGKEEIK